jgi:O-antigen ligase
MSEERGAGVGRTYPGAWLWGISRFAFGLTYLLFFSTPSWKQGAFALLPLFTVSMVGRVYPIGALVLLPVLALVAGVLGRLNGGARRIWHCWRMTLPVLSLGLLVLIRAWPVQDLLVSATASLAIGLFWFAYGCTVETLRERDIVALFAILLVLQGIVGSMQFLMQRSVGLGLLGEFVLHPGGKLVSVIEIGEKRWLRAYGLTGHPNLLGGYLVLWLLVCLGQVAGDRAEKKGFFLVRLAIAIGAVGVFCSFSRSAWLGLLLGLACFAALERARISTALHRLRERRVIVAALVLLSVVAVILFAYRELLLTRLSRLDTPLESRSIRERFEDVVQAWDLIRERPLLGVGSGYYLGALWDRAGDNPPPGFRLIHNIPLLALAELGILGPVLWLWLILTPPVALWRASRRRSIEPNEAGWAAAFVAATVFGLFDSYLYLPVTLWPTMCLGVLAGGWAKSYAQYERGGAG